jgi:hypothetical protein
MNFTALMNLQLSRYIHNEIISEKCALTVRMCNLDTVVKAATEQKPLKISTGIMWHLAPDILRSTSTVLVII